MGLSDKFLCVRMLGAMSTAALACLVVAPAWATDDAHWSSIVDTSIRYYTWSNSNAFRGSQVYAPLAIQTTGRPDDNWKLEFLVRSGAIFSQQTSPKATFSASSPTDTTLSSTATFYGINGVQPFVSININAPTGATSKGSSSIARPDSDLVATPVFGQGWNVGPSVGASVAIDQSLIATGSFGYLYRGPFVEGPAASPVAPLGETPPAGQLKPGDVYTVDLGLGYSGERFSSRGSISYSTEDTTYHGSSRLYQAGDRIITIAKAGYAWTDNWSSRLSGSFSHFGKNLIAMPGLPDMMREAMNSNSNVTSLSFDTSFARDNYSIGPVISYLLRDHNGYDPTNLMFIPAKTSWSLGVSGQISFTSNASFSASVQHVWVHENVNPDKMIGFFVIPGTGIPESNTNAWVATAGGTIRF